MKTIENADWNLEIGGLSEIVAYSKSPYAMLFDSIKDYPVGFRVATEPLCFREVAGHRSRSPRRRFKYGVSEIVEKAYGETG